MFSGTTLRHRSGNLLGAHQKIDKVAHRELKAILPDVSFPAIKDILHFEGDNGPDGLKRKSPAQDEPWHYYDPYKHGNSNQPIIAMIQNHHLQLVQALRTSDMVRAGFEAAWQAHTIVDGLTPAHHYPLEAKLVELRGAGIETRQSAKEKLIVRALGDTRRSIVRKNWEFWGAKGVMMTHILFELGVASTIAPLHLRNGRPSGDDIVRVQTEGIIPFFKNAATHINSLGMYEEFYRFGWTRQLARQTRKQLAPLIVKTVVLGWYAAAHEAQKDNIQ